MNHFILLPIALGSYDLYIMACRLVVAPVAGTARQKDLVRLHRRRFYKHLPKCGREPMTEPTERGSDTSWQRSTTGAPDDPVVGVEADEEE